MSKRGVGEHGGAHEGSQHVVGLEAAHLGHPRRPVPTLHGPAPQPGHRVQAPVGVHGMRAPHRAQQGQVEHAVGVGVAPRQVHLLLLRPAPDGGELARRPHELAVDTPRVAALLAPVAGGEHVVEPEQGHERGDEVRGRGGGEHDEVTGLAVLGQHARRVGLHELHQLGGGELAGAAHRLHLPSPGEVRGGTHHRHEGEALAHEVVEPVEDALAGQRPPPLEEPLGMHGRAQHEAAGSAQQRAVEVHEHRSTRARRVARGRPVPDEVMGLRRAGRHHGRDPTAAAPWPGCRVAGAGPLPGPHMDVGSGVTGAQTRQRDRRGSRSLCSDSTGTEGGVRILWSLRTIVEHAP